MAITVSLSTLLWVALLGVVAYIVYSLYQLFWVRPREFQKFWNDQGVRGTPYQFPLGTLPDIQRAADSDQIVQYAQKMANEYGLLQQQIVGCLCHIVVYDPQVVKHIMTSKAQFYHKASMSQKEIMRPLLHNGLLLSEDGYWRQQRTLLSPGFHFWYLQEMHSIIVSCIEGWAKQTGAQIDASPTGDVELEMSHELATQTLDSVATAAFGAGFRSDPKRADLFIHSLKQVLDNMQARTLNLVGFIPIIKQLPFPSYNAIKEGCANIDSIVGEIVRDRKEGRSKVVQGGEHAGSALLAERGEETRRRDLLDLLLDAQQNMPAGEVLTDRGVEEESINFIAAGAETTSNLCIWMLHRIITEPAAAPGQKTVLEKVRDEIDRVCQGELPTLEHLKELKYLEAVAYESLRLHPPAPTIPKYAIETHTMNMPDGRTLTIPEGTTMLMNANVIHRLEAYWPEPERFKPERFLAGGDADQGGDDGEKDGASPSPAPTPSPSPDGQKSSGASSGKTLTLEQKAIKAAQPFAFLGFSAGPRKCMPESDTRVLTDRGFLFLDEIEAYNAAHRRGDGPPLLFGCYDTEEQSLMYRPGTVVLSDPPERWVDFTDAHGQKHWDAGSSAFGVAAGVGAKGEVTSHVSLRVTPNHEMYVQVAARKMEGGHKHSARVPVLNNEEVPYQMVTAEELAPGYKCSCPADVLHPRGSKVTAETLCLHGYPVVRFLAAASAGITSQSFPVPCATLMPNPEDVSVGTERTEREHMDFIESPLHHVGLQTAAELDAFLEFYGNVT
jgi:cytochrome P450